MFPLVGADLVLGVRGHLHRVVVGVELAGLDGFAFGDDGLEGLDEAVEFAERFALGRLDHQGLVDRERQGGRVEAEVHEAFGHVGGVDAVGGFEVAQVDDALVGHAAGRAGVEGGEFGHQLGGHIVGVEDGDLGHLPQAFGAEHFNIGVRDRQEQRAAVRSRAHGIDTGAAAFADHRVARQERLEGRRAADGADARTAAAVGHGEGLVEVEVAHVRADESRVGEAHLGVHIGAVHIEEAAVAVDDVDDLADADLEHAVGGRIGDHHAGEFVARGGSLFSQFFHVDVAVVVAADEHDVEAAHRRRSGVGAVGGGGDDHHAAAGAVVGVEVAADGHQAGVFTRGAAVGLQRAAGEARDHGQVVLEFVDHLQGALGLVGGGVRVQVPNSLQLSGSISAAALSFMVQLPSGIMEWASEMSLRSSRLM